MDKTNAKRPDKQQSRQLTMRDMVAPLFRKRRTAIVTSCVVFGLVLLVAYGWASSYYGSTMQIVVERERAEPTLTSMQGGAELDNRVLTTDEVASEVALLQGRDMMEQVAQSCGLVINNPSIWDRFSSRTPQEKQAAAVESATKRLAKKITVEVQKTSHVIDLKYATSGTPQTPACVLQTLGKLYLEKHVRLQRPSGASDFFALQADKYAEALADSENRLSSFSKTEGIAAPEILRTDMAAQLATSKASLYTARQAIAADQRRLENIKQQMTVIPARSATTEASLAANALLEQLEGDLLNLQIKRTQLLVKFDPEYPLVKETDEEIAETKDAIGRAEKDKYINTTTDRDPTYEYLRQDQAKTEADLASEQATADALLKSIQGMQSDMVNLDVKAVEQGALLREAKANEGNYLLYLNKREQERTSDALDQRRIANVAIAVPANVPVLPLHNPNAIVFFGFFLALLAGAAAGYLAEFIDPSFRTPDEVADILNVRILAVVPKQAA